MSKYWIKYIAYGAIILGGMGLRIWRRSRTYNRISGTIPVNLDDADLAEMRKIFCGRDAGTVSVD